MADNNKRKKAGSAKTIYWLPGLALVIIIAWLFVSSFRGLMDYPDVPNTKTLRALSNPYSALAPRAALCDRDGNPLIAYVAANKNGVPQKDESGNYMLYYDLDKETRLNYYRKRIILAGGNSEQGSGTMCWSNLLSGWSSGLDSSYDNLLRMIAVDNGEAESLCVTIDSALQQGVYDALSERDRASAFVMDLTNGDVLAMASTPSYDYNDLLDGGLPFLFYADEACNLDNEHCCVEQFYKLWKAALLEDNPKHEKNSPYEYNGDAQKAFIRKLEKESFLLKEEQAQKIISYWQSKQYPANDEMLQNCTAYQFDQIYQKETENKDKFSFEEPEALGRGNVFVPFVKVKFPGENQEWRWLRIAYGKNNFVRKDCDERHFDPNFSFLNFNTQACAPGSDFKILMASMLVDQFPFLRSGAGADTEIQLGRVRDGSNNIPLPPVEYGRDTIVNLRQALIDSSNQYFSMTAMHLDVLNQMTPEQNGSRMMCYEDLADISPESTIRAARRMDQYYKDVFCMNQDDLDIDFTLNRSSIFPYFDHIEIQSAVGPNDTSDDRVLWNRMNGQEECTGHYYNAGIQLQKMLGDTAYGMGRDMMTPVYMSMVIGKALTGTMVLPNMLKNESGDVRTCGQPFSSADTPAIMRSHLASVFDSYQQSYRNVKIAEGLTGYAKTGTSSVEIRQRGTMGRYGTFAEVEKYPTYTSDRISKYETVWFVGAVSDGSGHMYAIVVRSYFKGSSGSLIKEFSKITDLLCERQYLKP